MSFFLVEKLSIISVLKMATTVYERENCYGDHDCILSTVNAMPPLGLSCAFFQSNVRSEMGQQTTKLNYRETIKTIEFEMSLEKRYYVDANPIQTDLKLNKNTGKSNSLSYVILVHSWFMWEPCAWTALFDCYYVSIQI